MGDTGNHRIILFDGVCNLCNSAVLFIIKRDKKDLFRFGALQEEHGQELVLKHNIDTRSVDSIILIERNKAYIKSSAALRIARSLSGGWPLLYGFIILPVFLRDWIYDFIAKNRYKWYGRRDFCMVPTPDLQQKFL